MNNPICQTHLRTAVVSIRLHRETVRDSGFGDLIELPVDYIVLGRAIDTQGTQYGITSTLRTI